MITGVILAHNEEFHIVDCIATLRPHVGELLLIDAESTDRTVELARPLVDRVLSHPNVPNFDAIRNIAIDEGRFEWFWFVDADERIPPRTGELVNELIRTRGDQFEAINIPFKSHFCGQWMRHCGWWPGYTVCRVLKRGHFEFGKNLHSGIYLKGRELRFPPVPELAIPHFSSRSLEHYVAKFNRYTSTEALQLHEAGGRYDWRTALSMMMHDWWEHYELHNARADGALGWILTWMAGQYRWLSHSKLIDQDGRNNGSVPESLDEVLDVMQEELAAYRTQQPRVPLGAIYRVPGDFDSQNMARVIESAARMATGRDVQIATPHRQAWIEQAGSHAALVRALTKAQRPRHSVGIHLGDTRSAAPARADVFSVFAGALPQVAVALADEEVRRLNLFDEIWVCDECERETLVREGLAPERIQIVRPEEHAQGVARLDDRACPPAAPLPEGRKVRVELEGELFAGHSFSNINEQLVKLLRDEPGVELSVRRVYYNPAEDRRVASAYELLPYVQRELSGPPQIVLRHAFPPNWSPPNDGLWVHIQPWEFGKLPAEWVPALRDRVDEIWAPSNYVKRVYVESGIDPAKIQVIPWGFDPGVFHSAVTPRRLPTEKRFKFVFVGGTIHRKGFDRVLEAYLAEFGPEDDVCLVVKDVGVNSFYAPHSHRNRILSAAADESAPEILYFDEELTPGQLASLYTACNCLVLPYRGEGFGLPVLEAMACGVPAIVPGGGSTDDFVSDETGFRLAATEVECPEIPDLCGTGTELEVSLAELRRVMRYAYDHAAETAQRGERAERVVHDSHTWRHVAPLFAARIEQLAQRTSAGEAAVGSIRLDAAIAVLPPEDDRDLAAALCQAAEYADSVYVVDSIPSATVLRLAQEYGARVVAKPESTLSQHAWVLFLNAHEELSERAVAAINAVLREVSPEATRIAVEVTERNGHTTRQSRLLRGGDAMPLGSVDMRRCEGAVESGLRMDAAGRLTLAQPERPSADQLVAKQAPARRRGILLQLATGDHRRLLALSRDLHRQYAARHGLEYHAVEYNPAAPKRAGWGKIRLILNAIEMGFDSIVWLDADAVLVDERVDLTQLIDQGIGMVRHPNGDGQTTHWNSGVIVLKASEVVRQFFEQVDREPENDSPWMEQLPINVLAGDYAQTLFHELHPAMNSTPGAVMAECPVVLAAHGLPFDQRLELIASWVQRAVAQKDTRLPALGSRREFGRLLNHLGLVGEGVEIGVLRGEFSRSLLDDWFGAKLHLVDPWRKLPESYVDIHNLDDTQHEACFRQTLSNLAPHAGRFAVHRMLSSEAAERFADASLDFIYIDADHEFSAVLRDIRSWYPKLKQGGILAGHDYLDGELPEGRFGVASAVRRFAAESGVEVQITREAAWPSWYCRKPHLS